MSQITTHILDIAQGKPAEGVEIILYQEVNNEWIKIAGGITNEDGRIKDLLKSNATVDKGNYKLRFESKDYFDKAQIQTFYPFVEIVFEIATTQHYHVPLLLSPFGYSTYRGS